MYDDDFFRFDSDGEDDEPETPVSPEEETDGDMPVDGTEEPEEYGDPYRISDGETDSAPPGSRAFDEDFFGETEDTDRIETEPEEDFFGSEEEYSEPETEDEVEEEYSAPEIEEPEEETEEPEDEVEEEYSEPEPEESEEETEEPEPEIEEEPEESEEETEEPEEEPEIEEEPEESEEETEEPKAGKGDERPISSDLIRGHINTIILRSLYDGDKYGYEIIAEIERKSHNQYSLKQPSLYSALKRLEREGYITSYWGGSVAGGRRKYFSLTDEGKEIAERNQTEWEYSRTVIDSLISDKDYDFGQPAPAAVDMRVLKQSTSRVPDRNTDEEEFDYDFEEEPSEPADLSAERAAFEEERSRYEESLRTREEVLRAREEAGTRREQELLEREFALQAEIERREQEAEQARLLAEEQANREQQQAEEQARYEEVRARAYEEVRAQLREEAEEQERQARERDRLLAEEQAKLEEVRAQAYEEARAEFRAQADEQARLQAEEDARRAEEQARLQAEEDARRAEEEAAQAAYEEEQELERARAVSLRAEKEEQNARIVEMEPFTEERARYEQMLRDQEAELRAMHTRALAEQEQRIREEDARNFREREQQIIHQNYLNLVQTPPQERQETPLPYSGQTNDPESYVYVTKPENEREYRNIINKLFNNTLRQEEPSPQPVEYAPAPSLPERMPEPAPVSPPKPAPLKPAPEPRKPAPERMPEPKPEPAVRHVAARSLGGVDFYDLETRATQDGIRISTSGGRSPKDVGKVHSESLVHKGKALFLSALVLFLLCVAEGSIALGFQNQLNLPRFYPYLIWGTGLAVLLVTGLAYLNRYGERALRRTGNLLVNTIVAYALSIIVILIVALAANIQFDDMGQLMTYIILPAIYFFGIIVFGVTYYLQIRPLKEE